MFYTLTSAAKEIGITRAWLYRKYLTRYEPIIIVERPYLSSDQVTAIKAEIKGRKKKSSTNGHK